MKNKYVFTAVLLAVILFVGNMLTMAYVRTEQSREQLKEGNLLVVTSFYPMYVAAENVIGDVEGVTLENLSEPQTGCLHDYQLTAADMKLLSKADVFIVNGGGIESFLSDVAESYPNLKIIQACDGIELLQAAEGTEDVDSDEAESEEHLHETETADTKAESDVHDEEAVRGFPKLTVSMQSNMQNMHRPIRGKCGNYSRRQQNFRRRLLHSRWWFFMKHMNISYRNMD